MNNWICPNCGKSDYTGGDVGMKTLMYFEPHYIDGVNVNPDRNTTTYVVHCCNCDKDFSVKSGYEFEQTDEIIK